MCCHWEIQSHQLGAVAEQVSRKRIRLMISYKIICAAGVLVQGAKPDFLLCIATAMGAKAVWSQRLPDSTLRVQVFYPNRKRVPIADVAAALRALENLEVAAAVARRRAVDAQIPPARSVARTAGIFAASGRGFAVAVGSDFCQAGVVAPPDSLTGETFNNYRDVGKPV